MRAAAADLPGQVATRADVGGIALLRLGAALGPVQRGLFLVRLRGGLRGDGRGLVGLLGIRCDGLGHGEPPRS
ncbi:hypothetical protein BJF90_06500 [Pseudonocardia sp. CNS-004]|nr:hypothetical protein BJF90_06500 [Pseudonocardia sp. CNS-004]